MKQKNYFLVSFKEEKSNNSDKLILNPFAKRISVFKVILEPRSSDIVGTTWFGTDDIV